jgi:hypothetical protein
VIGIFDPNGHPLGWFDPYATADAGVFDPDQSQVASGGGDVTVALTGVAATMAAGVLGVALTLGLTGATATASAGTVTPSTTVAVTGNAGTAAVGTVLPSAALALTGAAGTGAAGTVIQSRAVALTGASATGAAGTVTASGGNGGPVTVALTGVAGTGVAGTLSPTLTLAITGSGGTGSPGSVSSVLAAALTKVTGSGATGVLAGSRIVPLTGTPATGTVGTVNDIGGLTVGARVSATVAIARSVQAQVAISQGTAVPVTDWVLRSHLPAVAAEHTILEFNGSFWVFANNQVFKSDDSGASWVEVGVNALPALYVKHAACVFDGKMWLIGGYSYTVGDIVAAVYSTTNGLTWTPEISLPVPLADAGCVVFNGRIRIVGGYNNNIGGSRKVFSRTPSGTWEEAGTDVLPSDIINAGVVVQNGAVFTVGGADFATVGSQKVLSATNNDLSIWSEVGTDVLPYPVAGLARSVVVQGGYIWLVGGYNNIPQTVFARVFRSVAGQTWEEMASLPFGISNACAIATDMGVLLTGGYAGDNLDPIDTVYSLSTTPVAGQRATVAITQQLTDTEEL